MPLLWRGPLLQGMQTLPSKGTKTGCWQLCWLPHLRPSPCHNSKKIGGESGVEVLVFDGATGPSCIGELGAPGPSGTSNDEGAVAPFFSHRPKSGWSWRKACVQALQNPFQALRGGSWDSKQKGSRPIGGHHGDGVEPKSLPVETAAGVHGHGALLGALQGDYSTGGQHILRPIFGMRWLASHLFWPCLNGTRHFLAKLRTGKAKDDLSWRWPGQQLGVTKRLGG